VRKHCLGNGRPINSEDTAGLGFDEEPSQSVFILGLCQEHMMWSGIEMLCEDITDQLLLLT
jgi:hypothetical protein